VIVAGGLVLSGSFSTARPAGDIVPVYDGTGSSVGTPLSSPMGIFFDRSRNECYVADSGNHQIVVFDGNGLPIYRFYHYVERDRDGARVAGEPKSVVVTGDGTIFIVDAMAPYLDVTDPRGRGLRRIEVPADDCGAVERFESLCLDAHGTVYAVTACAPPRVAVIADGFTIARMVALDRPALERTCVTGLAVDGAANLYVTDPCGEKMVQVYSPEGAFVASFGAHDSGFENFSFAAGIAVMNSGDLWIVDSIRQVASQFSHEGKLLATIGGKGSQPGAFEYPSAVTTDGESRLFVLERKGNRYQCFRITEGSGTAVD
jgi:sugar lactone lactonase YvrE